VKNGSLEGKMPKYQVYKSVNRAGGHLCYQIERDTPEQAEEEWYNGEVNEDSVEEICWDGMNAGREPKAIVEEVEEFELSNEQRLEKKIEELEMENRQLRKKVDHFLGVTKKVLKKE